MQIEVDVWLVGVGAAALSFLLHVEHRDRWLHSKKHGSAFM